MSVAPNPDVLTDSQVVIFLETRPGQNHGHISNKRLGALLAAVDDTVTALPGYRQEVALELTSIVRGSLTIYFEWIGQAVDVLDTIKTAAELWPWLQAMLPKRKNKLALTFAELIEDDDVQAVSIITRSGQLSYTRNNLPALEHLRLARLAGVSPEQLPSNVVVTDDGHPVRNGRGGFVLSSASDDEDALSPSAPRGLGEARRSPTFDDGATTFDDDGTTFDSGDDETASQPTDFLNDRPDPLDLGAPLPAPAPARSPTQDEIRRRHAAYPVTEPHELYVLELRPDDGSMAGPLNRFRGRFQKKLDGNITFESGGGRSNEVVTTGGFRGRIPFDRTVDVVGPIVQRPTPDGRVLTPITHIYAVEAQ